MAFFVLNSEITIGPYRLKGVQHVYVKRSLLSMADMAVIRFPKRGLIQKGTLQPDGSIKILPGTAIPLNLGTAIKADMPVTIKLGYNGDLKEEFRGFVRRKHSGRPLAIECEGYVRQMRNQVTVNGVLKSTNAKELLELACGIRELKDGKAVKLAKPKTDITVVCQDDIPMHNIQITEANGVAIADEVKKIAQGTLAVFFVNPTTLWCGFIYTPYAGKDAKDPWAELLGGRAAYRLGYNCPEQNNLRERVVDEPVQVIMGGTYVTGKVVQTTSEVKYHVKKDKTIQNNVQDVSWMKKMANEKQYRLNYNGYEGSLTGFLQPFCLPGFIATIKITEYPEQDGDYMALSTEVNFGTNGARRSIEVGPLVGFDPNKLRKDE